MEVAKGKTSLNTNSEIDINCMKRPLLVCLKIESKSEDEQESATDLLYADHVIKKEMVIGPTVIQKVVHHNSNCTKDVPKDLQPVVLLERLEQRKVLSAHHLEVSDEPLRKKPKLHEKTNQGDHRKETTNEIGTQDEITVSDADILLHKKPRLQTQEETTDRQKNINSDTEVVITSNFDSKIEASAYIQTEQEEKTKIVTKKSKPSNKSKTVRKIQVEDKNVNRLSTYNNIFTCDDCGELFKRKRKLIKHIESHEQIKHKIYLKCKECTYQTINQDTLERHKKLHDKSRRYVCDVCGCRFKCKGKLKKHLRCAHSGKKTHGCGICDYRTNDISYLNIHMTIHSGEKPYSCSLCEYKCRQKSYLTYHMKIHTGEKPFSCTECEYRCSQKSSLIEHMRIHTGEKLFSCNVCEYRCTRKKDLIRHMKLHTGEKPFSCSVCEYSCTRKDNLIRHMKQHIGEKPFSCSVCGYRCTHKYYLIRHMKLHTGEKPFSCSVCEYRCYLKNNLTQHMQMHTGEKPFSCSVCEYRCTQKNNLIRHMKLHTSEKPFSCAVCEFRCVRKDALTRHERIHNE